MPLDYDIKLIEEHRKNLENIRRDLPKMEKKISNFCARFGFDKGEVKRQILENKILAACFALDPTKQSFHENCAAEFIEQIEGVKEFRQLPRNALYVVKGSVHARRELQTHKKKTKVKSIDFSWHYAECQFFAAHKHAKEEGGAQANQYNELLRFVEECNPSKTPDYYFVAIADGAFYQMKDSLAQNTRLGHLQNTANRKNVFACTIDDLESLMQQICRHSKR